jgi:hypothetical protein
MKPRKPQASFKIDFKQKFQVDRECDDFKKGNPKSAKIGDFCSKIGFFGFSLWCFIFIM